MLSTIALGATLLLSQTAQQFDLICTGETEGWSDEYTRVTTGFDTRVRVDLERMIWCAATCERVSPIVRATNAELVLTEDSRDNGFINISIDRVTGVYRLRVKTDLRRTSVNADAQCTRAAYTLIPAAAF